jgi:hypothetical protein
MSITTEIHPVTLLGNGVRVWYSIPGQPKLYWVGFSKPAVNQKTGLWPGHIVFVFRSNNSSYAGKIQWCRPRKRGPKDGPVWGRKRKITDPVLRSLVDADPDLIFERLLEVYPEAWELVP